MRCFGTTEDSLRRFGCHGRMIVSLSLVQGNKRYKTFIEIGGVQDQIGEMQCKVKDVAQLFW